MPTGKDHGEGAAHVSEKLRATIAGDPVVHDGIEVNVTASLGWATWAGEDADALVRRADEALYEAKDAGRNCVRGEA